MASVIIEGGNDPIIAKTWKDTVRVRLLHDIYSYCGHVGDLTNIDVQPKRFISKDSGDEVTVGDVRAILIEMYEEGLITGIRFKCNCCAHQKFPPKEVLDHVLEFKLTQKGFDRTPEHIFP